MTQTNTQAAGTNDGITGESWIAEFPTGSGATVSIRINDAGKNAERIVGTVSLVLPNDYKNNFAKDAEREAEFVKRVTLMAASPRILTALQICVESFELEGEPTAAEWQIIRDAIREAKGG